MKVEFWALGNTSFAYLKEGTAIYEKRLKHYLPFEYKIFSDIKQAKNLSEAQLKEKEGLALLSKVNSGDCLILMDENGKRVVFRKICIISRKQATTKLQKTYFCDWWGLWI